MINVFSLPTPQQAALDTSNSINRIVLCLQKYLPQHGSQIVDDPHQADLIAAHAGMAPMSVRDRICVAHCHGLYPTAYQDQVTGWHWQANNGVVQNVIGARRVTVPSQWVADIFRRDMHFNPDVIGWGIDFDEWQDAVPQGYVLWNKTRTDGVCTPVPVNQLAMRMPQVPFLTTFAAPNPPGNIRETGRVVYEQMKQMVKGASVYLATTKETFGIGTLEAMAAGIPVLGFRHGATPDIVEHGVNGYLVDPGDYDGLASGLEYCFQHRAVLGNNARRKAASYTWNSVVGQFHDVYIKALETPQNPRVTIVIPCYNYARFVGQAVESAIMQRLPDGSEPEIIIVNDGSTDDSLQAARSVLRKQRPRLNNVKIIDQQNSGVAAARNAGIEASAGEFIVCLDADDMLAPGFIDTCCRALDADRTLGIVFTSLQMMAEDGSLGSVSSWPYGYDFDQACAAHNQVPTCCMFRKEAWRRAGGYRAQYTPAEDAELWLRIGSLGYRAKHCSEQPLFRYRLHNKSLSTAVRTGQAREPNWRDKVWVTDGQRPFASDGKPPFYSWPVRNYDNPKVSIIVPVGPYHQHNVRAALDSIENQSERAWECIVVNDSGTELDLHAYPWARVLTSCSEGGCGPSASRNAGIRAARAPLVTFLDADDIFHQDFLKETLKAYAIHHRYVYTDWVSLNKAGQYEIHETPEYDQRIVFNRTSIHSINILILKDDILSVGGFDESMNSWEDTDLSMKLAAAGICGVRCAKPLMEYRYQTGQLRELGFEREQELKKLLYARYVEQIEGGKMAECGCGASPVNIPSGPVDPAQGVRVQYNGPIGTIDVIGVATKRSYGRRVKGDIFYVYAADMQATPKLFTPVIDPMDFVKPTPIPAPPVALEAI